MTEGRDQPPIYGFEADQPGTNARTEAEAHIESLRQAGGIFTEAVARTRMPMAVTDFRLPGNPIVFANDAFLRLSGYSMQEVLGQKPHFLNGPDTDPDDAARFREALRRGEDIVVDTWQYRKDRTPFYAAVFVSPIADGDGQVIQHFLSYLDITRRVEAEQQVRRHAADLEARIEERTRTLAEGEAKYRTLFEGMAEGFCIFDMIFDEAGNAIDYRFVEVNPAFEHHSGLVGAGGKRMRDLAPGHEAHWYDAFDRVAKTGQPASLELPSDALGNRWFEVHAFRLGAPEQARVAAIFQDITERKDAEVHQRTLVAELQHRVRNTLGVVRSIARRTAQNSASVEELSAHLDGRIEAFARVQAAVTRNPTGGVDLAGLIEDELVAHATREGETVTLDGPDVTLAVRPAETLSLAFHELVTNAVKYGALGSPQGRLAIGWTLADGRLEFSWRESGAPSPAAKGEREGFGFELLRRVIPYELSARTVVEFRPDGLVFTLSMPAEGNLQAA